MHIKKLFKLNYFVALIAVITIIINYVGYDNCRSNKNAVKTYLLAVGINVISILMLMGYILMFIITDSNFAGSLEGERYKYTVVNSIALLFLLITFVNSANYFNNCKDLKQNLTTDNDTNTDNNIIAGTNTNTISLRKKFVYNILNFYLEVLKL